MRQQGHLSHPGLRTTVDLRRRLGDAPSEFLRAWRRRRTKAAGGVDPFAGPHHPPTRRTAKMARLEAALLVADGATSARRLAQLAILIDAREASALIDQLNDAYDATGSAFRIERVGTGYRMLTRPEFSPWLDRLHRRPARLKLSPPAMETLTIIAYRQPITRADVEQIRGVQSAEMLKQLMDRGLVRIAGNDDSLGRPYLYGTTKEFLELFGLRSLDDLPMADSLRRAAAETAGNADTEGEPSVSETTAAEHDG